MADLPPRDVWIAGANSLTRWRPAFDWIEVHGAADGKWIRLQLAGQEHQIDLTQAQADHLAALLKAPI